MLDDKFYDNLYQGISKVAWGYVFLLFHINLGTLNILPTFVGFLLFLSAIHLLQEIEPELALLQPFGVALTIWYVIEWLMKLFGGNLGGGFSLTINVIICIMNVYFQFQLLTNVSTIATKYQSEETEFDAKLLRYRNVQVIATTGAMILTYLVPQWLGDVGAFFALIWTAVALLVGICLMVTLFKFKNEFQDNIF